jgi:Histidine kinase-, DNA gyrase B-, and HSP90-like ATPase
MTKSNASLLHYPKFFQEKLGQAPKTRAELDSTIALIADVLQVSKLPFFPDYTDHGYEHLSKVIEIAAKLIPETAHAICTPEDTAVLIFSILLHDLALHLSEAGFLSLLKSPDPETSNAMNSAGWSASWEDFLSVARHWDDRKLVELFGADESGAPLALIRNPLEHYENLTESDRKLIGEFIRQHHAQMAYEFAVAGFPGPDGQRIEFGAFDTEVRQIAGIVARSHGYALRHGIRELEERQISKLEQDNIHPIFLMGILRVADFLELGADRAPLIAFRYKELKSLTSKNEWQLNQAFRKISWSNPDAESIHIPAKPKDIQSFLELKRWLQAIQAELDLTWAVMGEIYGSQAKYSRFGLTIRRVRSNITDDLAAFANLSSFVPRRVELGVAGPDILKLFIEPLYGERPEIGIRELMQNAIDAVRERREFEKHHPDLADLPRATHEGDIEVWLDDPDENGVSTLTVSDKGIGMTEEVIAEYFLKAGASFRRSIAWKKEFEVGTEASSKPKIKSHILRSGRFGIGVLAAFLLGDRIEVATRHITNARGIRFSLHLDLQPAALEMKPIQLDYDEKLAVGTVIKVSVTKLKPGTKHIDESDIFSSSHLWDWYCLEEPSVIRLRGKNKTKLEQSVTVPAEGATLPAGWHLLPLAQYRAVHALVHGASVSYPGGLVCNGIGIRGAPVGVFSTTNILVASNPSTGSFPYDQVLTLHTPGFSVFDPDGVLPLNLQRTGLTGWQSDFVEAAFAAQARASLALFMLSAPEEQRLTEEIVDALWLLGRSGQTAPLFFTQGGTAFLTEKTLRIAKAKRCLLMNARLFAQGVFSDVTAKYDALLIAKETKSSAKYSLNEINRWIASARAITTSDERFIVGDPLRFSQQLSESPLYLHRTWRCPDSLLVRDDLAKIYKLLPQTDGESGATRDDFVAAELYLKDTTESPMNPRLSLGHYWEEIIRDPVIPFSRTAREEQLKHAYAALAEYLPDAGATRARILKAIEERPLRTVRVRHDTQETVKADCPHCGKPLRTPMAKQCRFCGADWHEPAMLSSKP